MDTDELHEHLREIAATGSIDASTDRSAVDSRARRYRRHRRRVASALVVLGVAGMLVVLIVLTGGNGSRSVHVPPAQSTNPKSTLDRVGMCVSGMSQEWPTGTLSVVDFATGVPIDMPIAQYCAEQDSALTAAGIAPGQNAPAGSSFEVWNGHVTLVTPPASSDTTNGNAAPSDTVAACIAREAVRAAADRTNPPSGMVASDTPAPSGMKDMWDEGTKQSTLVPVEKYCSIEVQQEASMTDPRASFQIYLENGVIKTRPGPPVSLNDAANAAANAPK